MVFTNETGSMYVGDVLTTTIPVVTDECGLNGQATVDVDICEMVIPNVFTPNEDNKNDEFQIGTWSAMRAATCTSPTAGATSYSARTTGQWDGEGCRTERTTTSSTGATARGIRPDPPRAS